VRRAHFDLSLIRQEVESMGSTYLPAGSPQRDRARSKTHCRASQA
jgi:hypothetical protein